MSRLWDAKCEVLESWQEAAGARAASGSVSNEGALVLEVCQERPPLHMQRHNLVTDLHAKILFA